MRQAVSSVERGVRRHRQSCTPRSPGGPERLPPTYREPRNAAGAFRPRIESARESRRARRASDRTLAPSPVAGARQPRGTLARRLVRAEVLDYELAVLVVERRPQVDRRGEEPQLA